MKYIIVRVERDNEHDYDYIEGVEFVKDFNTLQEARSYKLDLIKECEAQNKNRMDYIKNFVDSIEMPEITETNFNVWENEVWQKFIVQCCGFLSYISPERFKEHYCTYLFINDIELENTPERLKEFSPPQIRQDHLNLFIVEVK